MVGSEHKYTIGIYLSQEWSHVGELMPLGLSVVNLLQGDEFEVIDASTAKDSP